MSFFRREREPRDNQSQNNRSGGFNSRGGGENRERSPRDRNNSFDREREESVFESKVRAGKRRTYFFDVRKTKGEDYFLTITESTKRFDGSYERHKIFLYKEDFNRFEGALSEVLSKIKTEFMPDFDYDEYDRRQKEWEEKQAQLALEGETAAANPTTTTKNDFTDDDTNDEEEEKFVKQMEAKAAAVTTATQDDQKTETDFGRAEAKRSSEIEDDMAW